ncbi:unnamed protein product [Echinostoma caproni]|uniref:RH2 domain-containing protein n=1 Tax=Echinostoma caproni TaxID=27848 RepID=A0A183ADH2_9TREM|nr:unnamed protein product [Echinostoma caproni]
MWLDVQLENACFVGRRVTAGHKQSRCVEVQLVARMEAKEVEWKKESQRLHEHINELIRSKLDLADQVKFANQSAANASNKTGAAVRLGSSAAPTLGLVVGLTGEGDTQLHPPHENMYDATSSGFGFDEMPSSDAEGVPLDEEIPAGMRREIDILIRENMELVETKNALNVVKDDLITKLDSVNLDIPVQDNHPNCLFAFLRHDSENASLRESVAHLTQSRATLQSELASTDQLLNDTRHELEELRDRLTASSHRFESTVPESGSGSMHRKRFTRAEMARVLSERNQYKERLMELQEAVHLTEALRAGQKGHPELLLGLSAAAGGPSLVGSGLTSHQAPTASNRPLQTLQNL